MDGQTGSSGESISTFSLYHKRKSLDSPVWKVLPQKTKRGNLNTAQRIALIDRQACIVPASDIEVLTMIGSSLARNGSNTSTVKGLDSLLASR